MMTPRSLVFTGLPRSFKNPQSHSQRWFDQCECSLDLGKFQRPLGILCSQGWEPLLIDPCYLQWGFPCASGSKESVCNSGDLGSIPGLGRCSEEGKGYPFQYSGLENPMDCVVQGVEKSQTRLSDFTFLAQQGLDMQILRKSYELKVYGPLSDWNGGVSMIMSRVCAEFGSVYFLWREDL